MSQDRLYDWIADQDCQPRDGGCSRCGSYECICGDPAVEEWADETLKQMHERIQAEIKAEQAEAAKRERA
jgi:hypothetical protein